MANALALGLAIAGLLVGLGGTILPVLPGLPLMVLVAALYGWWEGFRTITVGYLAAIAALVVGAGVIEHLARAWGTRRFGGSRLGAWGAIVGSLVGIFFAPAGLVAGPLVGAIAGELLAGRRVAPAIRSGIGSVIGMLAGMAFNVAMGLLILLTFLYRAVGGVV